VERRQAPEARLAVDHGEQLGNAAPRAVEEHQVPLGVRLPEQLAVRMKEHAPGAVDSAIADVLDEAHAARAAQRRQRALAGRLARIPQDEDVAYGAAAHGAHHLA
jgi:hypothetical protein